jgi:hypothetical protein
VPRSPFSAVAPTSLTLLLLVACSYVIRLTADDLSAPAPRFSIQSVHGALGVASLPGLQEVFVSNAPANNASRAILWRISATHPIQVAHLTYGVAPPGFAIDTPAVPLSQNTTYNLVVSTGDGGYGSLRFGVEAPKGKQ